MQSYEDQRITMVSRHIAPTALGTSDTLYLALSFASVSSLVDLGIVAGRWALSDKIVRDGAFYLWIAPLGHLLLFLAGSLLLLSAKKYWRALAAPRVAVLWFTWLAVALPLWESQRLHKIAGLLLAVGITVMAGRLATLYGNRMRRVNRRLAACTTLSVACLVIGLMGWSRSNERRQVSNLRVPSDDATNIVVIVLDTLRADELGCYGHRGETTPNLDRLADDSMQYMRAYSTAPWTLPSHASIFTGYLPSELSCDFATRLDDRQPTLAEILKSSGYHTAGFVANKEYCSAGTGLARGFIHYDDANLSVHAFLTRTTWGRAFYSLRRRLGWKTHQDRKSAGENNADFLTWLTHDRRSDRPFFAFLNFVDVHDPYYPPRDWKCEFGPVKGDVDLSRDQATLSNVQSYRIAYDSCLTYLDAQIGHLLAALDEKGLLDTTLLIVTSDHGEHFGEHELLLHGHSLYEPLVWVPLLIRLPGAARITGRIDEPVSLVNLGRTILDVAIADAGHRLPGTSFANDWKENSKRGGTRGACICCEVSFRSGRPSWMRSKTSGIRALISGNYKYIVDGEGREELYDVRSDVGESRNIVRDPAQQPMVSMFRRSYKSTWNTDPVQLRRGSGQLVHRDRRAD